MNQISWVRDDTVRANEFVAPYHMGEQNVGSAPGTGQDCLPIRAKMDQQEWFSGPVEITEG